MIQTLTRRAPCTIGVAIMLLVVAGCGRNDNEASAGGDVAIGTPATPGAQAGTMDTNEAEDRVEAALNADAMLGAFDLDADHERDRLVLEGVVATDAQRTRAAEIAASAAPGIAVDNQVRVDAAARREAADDAADEAEDRVEDAFDDDATLGTFDLDADDEDGGLVLSGTVQTAVQRSQAEELARRIAPGLRLDNRIRVQ